MTASETWHHLVRRYIALGKERYLRDASRIASDSDVRDLISTYISAGPDRYIDRLTEWLADRPKPHVEPEERTFILLEYFLHARKAADRSVSLSENQLREGTQIAEEGLHLSQALGAPACEGRFQAFRGRIHWRLEEYDRALSALGAAIESYQEDSGNDESELLPNRARLHVLQGSVLGDRERLAPALEAFREALSALEGREGDEALYYRAVAYVDRANVLRRSNEHRQAEADLDKALELFGKLTGEALPKDLSGKHSRRESHIHKRTDAGGSWLKDPSDGKALWAEQADALSIRAAVRGNRGKLHQAEEDLNRALEIYQVLGAGASEADRAKTYASRGNIRRQTGRLWDAKADYDTAIRYYGNLDATLHRRDRAIARSNRADVRTELGDLRGAESDCSKALALLRESDEEAGRGSRVNALLTRGIVREERGKWPEAEADFDAALELLANTPRDKPRGSESRGSEKHAPPGKQSGPREKADRTDRALLHLNRGTVRMRRGRWQGAKADFDRARSLYGELGEVYTQDQALTLINRGDLHRSKGNLEAAEDDLTDALSLLGRLGEAGTRETRAFALSARGSLRHEQGELEAAEKDCTASLRLYDELVEVLSGPPDQSEETAGQEGNKVGAATSPPYLTDRAVTLMHRGIVRWNRENLKGAKADYNATLALFEGERRGSLKADRALVQLNRGLLFLGEGDLESARNALSTAADLAEEARAGHARLGDRGHVQSEFARVFRRLVDTHLRLFEKTGERAHLCRAWHAAERGRGRRLLDQFGSDGLRLETEKETAEELRRVRQEIRDLNARLRRDRRSNASYASELKIEITDVEANPEASGPASQERERPPRGSFGPRPLSRHRLKSVEVRARHGSREAFSRRSGENGNSPFPSDKERGNAEERLEDLLEREEALNRHLLREFGAGVADVPHPEKLGSGLRALAGEEGGLLVQWVHLGPSLTSSEEGEDREYFALFLLPIGEISETGKNDSGKSRGPLPIHGRLVSVPPEMPGRWRAAVNRLERQLRRVGQEEATKSGGKKAFAEACSELDHLLDAMGEYLGAPLVEAIHEEVGDRSMPGDGSMPGEGQPPLLMVPDGVLSMLPLHAARLSDGEPLFMRWPVTYLGSAAMARRLAHSEGARIAGGGLPQTQKAVGREEEIRSKNEGQPPCVSIFGPPSEKELWGAMEETRKVQDLWEGANLKVHTCALEEMTVEAFARCSEEMTLATLHTHSEFRSGRDYPNSQIRFYDGGLRLSQLAVDERFEFPRLRFVRLSSCQSARSSRREGELRGLVWAFLQAGAGAVEGTLWRVPDDAARRHGIAVHQALREGKTVTEAHCQALRRMHREHPEDPFAWASFALYGNGFRRII